MAGLSWAHKDHNFTPVVSPNVFKTLFVVKTKFDNN